MDEKRKNFFMIPNAVIDSGLLARMKQSEKSVYLVLCRYAHPKSGLAYPSIEKLAELTGSAKVTICQVTDQLAIYGLITKRRAPAAFNFRMIYRVIKEPEIDKHIIPWKKDKCKPKRDKKTGKFIKSPCSKELDTSPSSKELDNSPCSKEQKKIEEDLKRLTIKTTKSLTEQKTKEKSKGNIKPRKAERPRIEVGEKAWEQAFSNPGKTKKKRR